MNLVSLQDFFSIGNTCFSAIKDSVSNSITSFFQLSSTEDQSSSSHHQTLKQISLHWILHHVSRHPNEQQSIMNHDDFRESLIKWSKFTFPQTLHLDEMLHDYYESAKVVWQQIFHNSPDASQNRLQPLNNKPR